MPTAHRNAGRRGRSVPPDDDVRAAHARYVRDRHPGDLRLLVEAYLPLAEREARRFPRGSAALEDVQQAAYEALIGAVVRYDPAHGVPFEGFASVTIRGSLKRYLRDTRWAVRVPRRCRDLSTPVRRARELLEQDLGRAPTPAELADWFDVDVSEIHEVLRAEHHSQVRSLDDAVLDGDDPAVARRDGNLQRVEDRWAVAEALVVLSPEDRLLVERYYRQGLTQSQLATLMGVSQMQVSRELSRVVHRLRRALAPV
jgi:RNA polymerase sigma-B factor